MSTVQQTWPVYGLLADGSTAEIRPAGPADFDAVKAMHEAMSPENAYLRFFIPSRTAAETEARRLCREPGPGRMALLALTSGEVVRCASCETLQGQPGDKAEAAVAVADHMHHKGIATLLLEHLVSYASSHQITTFIAQTLAGARAHNIRTREIAVHKKLKLSEYGLFDGPAAGTANALPGVFISCRAPL
jgi:L-amino acid N-acyltransferase YncA